MIEIYLHKYVNIDDFFSVKHEIDYEKFIKNLNKKKSNSSLFDVNFLEGDAFLFKDNHGYYCMGYIYDDEKIISEIIMLEKYFEIEIVKYKRSLFIDSSMDDMCLYDIFILDDVYFFKIPGPKLLKTRDTKYDYLLCTKKLNILNEDVDRMILSFF